MERTFVLKLQLNESEFLTAIQVYAPTSLASQDEINELTASSKKP